MEGIFYGLLFLIIGGFIIYSLMKYAAKNAIKEFYNETLKKDFIDKKSFLESDINLDEETLLLMKNHNLITEDEFNKKKKSL